MRLQHVSIAIPPDGRDDARAFYGGLLGLEERPVPPKLDGEELRAAQREKDAVRAYELVYAALGA